MRRRGIPHCSLIAEIYKGSRVNSWGRALRNRGPYLLSVCKKGVGMVARALFIVRPWLLKLGESTSKSESIPQNERAASTTTPGVGGRRRRPRGGVSRGARGRGGGSRASDIHGEGRRVSNKRVAAGCPFHPPPRRPTKLI